MRFNPSRSLLLDFLTLFVFSFGVGVNFLRQSGTHWFQFSTPLFILTLFFIMAVVFAVFLFLKISWAAYPLLFGIVLDMTFGFSWKMYLFTKSLYLTDFTDYIFLGAAFFPILLFCYLIRRKITSIALSMAVTFFIFSLTGFAQGATPPVNIRQNSNLMATTGMKPNIFVIILDSYMAPEGLAGWNQFGADLRDKLVSDYVSAGFNLYGCAYSNYHQTLGSLSSIFNGSISAGFSKEGLVNYSHENSLFKKFIQEGYKINIYQSSYFDLSHGFEESMQKRVTYANRSGELLQAGSFTELDRWYLLSRNFFGSSKSRFLKKILVRLLPESVVELTTGPLMTEPLLTEVGNDIASNRTDTVFVVHLLIPHEPYIYRANSKPKNTWEWLSTHSHVPIDLRYNAYIEQAAYTHNQIWRFFKKIAEEGIYDDSHIVVFGDHGARILPTKKTRLHEPQDLINYHSAFLAIKPPTQSMQTQTQPSYRLDQIPLAKELGNYFGLLKDNNTREFDKILGSKSTVINMPKILRTPPAIPEK